MKTKDIESRGSVNVLKQQEPIKVSIDDIEDSHDVLMKKDESKEVKPSIETEEHAKVETPREEPKDEPIKVSKIVPDESQENVQFSPEMPIVQADSPDAKLNLDVLNEDEPQKKDSSNILDDSKPGYLDTEVDMEPKESKPIQHESSPGKYGFTIKGPKMFKRDKNRKKMFDAESAFAAIGQKGAFKINNNNI